MCTFSKIEKSAKSLHPNAQLGKMCVQSDLWGQHQQQGTVGDKNSGDNVHPVWPVGTTQVQYSWGQKLRHCTVGGNNSGTIQLGAKTQVLSSGQKLGYYSTVGGKNSGTVQLGDNACPACPVGLASTKHVCSRQ